MRVKVTLGHIAKAKEQTSLRKYRSLTCPIAVALHEMTGDLWSVGFRNCTNHSSRLNYDLPENAQKFIIEADNTRDAVNPIEFDLPI